jgi:8-oxo-dGTP pyrophosphatase MutT (NUDIX family)
LVFPGGHPEPKDVGFDGDTDAMDVSRYMFESALSELREELGVDEERVRRLRCLGVTLRVVNARPCVVFYARTALSSDEILRDFYPNAEHAFESTRAVALAIDEFDRSAMPGDHVGALDFVAVALAHDDGAVALADDDPPWRRSS